MKTSPTSRVLILLSYFLNWKKQGNLIPNMIKRSMLFSIKKALDKEV